MNCLKNSTSKKLISTLELAILLFGVMSCGQPQNYAVKEARSHTALAAKPGASENFPARTDQAKQTSREQPTIGTVKNMVNGDLMCYVTLVDENNTEHEVGADFDICVNRDRFLNKKVRLSYEIASINDCQSSEPCGKSRKESIISQMEIIGQGNSKNPSNSQILSNGKWTITIGNIDSWSGVNGRGNLSYRGCDAQGNCINLTGGQVTCRNGVCAMGWRNGDYLYTVEQPMSNPDRPQEPGSTTILTVRKGSKVILRETGFR